MTSFSIPVSRNPMFQNRVLWKACFNDWFCIILAPSWVQLICIFIDCKIVLKKNKKKKEKAKKKNWGRKRKRKRKRCLHASRYPTGGSGICMWIVI